MRATDSNRTIYDKENQISYKTNKNQNKIYVLIRFVILYYIML